MPRVETGRLYAVTDAMVLGEMDEASISDLRWQQHIILDRYGYARPRPSVVDSAATAASFGSPWPGTFELRCDVHDVAALQFADIDGVFLDERVGEHILIARVDSAVALAAIIAMGVTDGIGRIG